MLLVSPLFSQTGVLKGRVYSELNNDPVEFANIIIEYITNIMYHKW